MDFNAEQAVALVEVRELLRAGGFDVDSQSDEQVIGAVTQALALWQVAARSESLRLALQQMARAKNGGAALN